MCIFSFIFFEFPLTVHMKLFIFIFTCHLLSIEIIHGQSMSCSCSLNSAGMTMICTHVHSLTAYQQCVHEQLNGQSDIKLRRGGVITNLTIIYHQLHRLSAGLLEFSYGHNNIYRFSDLRYLYIVHGTLKCIENGALKLIEHALEYLDLSNNKFQHMPKTKHEHYNNLV